MCTCAVLQSSMVSCIAIKCAFVQLFIYITNFALSLKATLEILSNGIKNNRNKEWRNGRVRERRGRGEGRGEVPVSLKRGIIYFIHLGSSDIKETQTISASPHATLRPCFASPCHAWCLAVIAYRLLSTLFTYFKNPPWTDSLARPPREGIG